MKGTSSINFGTDKIDRTFILNSIGSAFGKNTITLSPTSTNSCPESGALISAANDNECLIPTGTALVDSKFSIFNWKVPCKNSSSDDHPNRCLKNGVGSSFSENNNQRSLVKPGIKLAHKHFGSSGNKASSDQFFKNQKKKLNSLSSSNHNS